MVDSSQSIADVPVTADLLRSAVSAINDAPEGEGATLQDCVKAIIEVLLDEGVEEQQQLVELGSAICARLMAFATLMKTEPAEPWLARTAGGAIVAFDRPLLEAMAVAPLALDRGRYEFDPQRFFEIVLERSPVAGCG